MHKIVEFYFDYIFAPTAAVAYIVFMWALIVWGIQAVNEMRRKQKKAEKGQGDETDEAKKTEIGGQRSEIR